MTLFGLIGPEMRGSPKTTLVDLVVGPFRGGPEMTPVWPYSEEMKTIPADLILGLDSKGGSRNDSGLGHPH